MLSGLRAWTPLRIRVFKDSKISESYSATLIANCLNCGTNASMCSGVPTRRSTYCSISKVPPQLSTIYQVTNIPGSGGIWSEGPEVQEGLCNTAGAEGVA
jgi:hypothetical protein